MTRHFSVRSLAGGAVCMAMAVVLARLLSFAPTQSTRYSLETLPILFSGLLFGPVCGALVGFGSDALGCLLSPYGYNPLFCLPPLLLGLWAGLCRGRVQRSPGLANLGLALAPPIALGYILIQSAAFAFVYHRESFCPFFAANLGSRGIQYAVIFVLDLILARLLYPALRRAAGGPQTGGTP